VTEHQNERCQSQSLAELIAVEACILRMLIRLGIPFVIKGPVCINALGNSYYIFVR